MLDGEVAPKALFGDFTVEAKEVRGEWGCQILSDQLEGNGEKEKRETYNSAET